MTNEILVIQQHLPELAFLTIGVLGAFTLIGSFIPTLGATVVNRTLFLFRPITIKGFVTCWTIKISAVLSNVRKTFRRTIGFANKTTGGYIKLFTTISTSRVGDSGLFNLHSMMMRVFSTVLKKLEIFYSVVSPIVINVVNRFSSFEVSSKMFFHNKPVFKNILTFTLIGMSWGKNKNIISTVYSSPPLQFELSAPRGWFFIIFCRCSSVRGTPFLAKLIFFNVSTL